MFIATIVLSVLVAAAVLGSGAAKLAGAQQSIAIRDRLGVTAGLWRGIGILEVGAAADWQRASRSPCSVSRPRSGWFCC